MLKKFRGRLGFRVQLPLNRSPTSRRGTLPFSERVLVETLFDFSEVQSAAQPLTKNVLFVGCLCRRMLGSPTFRALGGPHTAVVALGDGLQCRADA